MLELTAGLIAILIAVPTVLWASKRLKLSRAKHPSLRGHSKLSKRLARWLPMYSFDEASFFSSDGVVRAVQEQRRTGLLRLAERLAAMAPRSEVATRELSTSLSDLQLTAQYRVPFPFRQHLASHINLPAIVDASQDNRLRDLDGNWYHDLTGAYGVNLMGTDFYKRCIEVAIRTVGDLGPVLGPCHPVLLDNASRLRRISGKREVSFHMSGTEAVMQAVALARYHTDRPRVVRFCGAYHGWWDGVQPGPGNPRITHDVYTLKEMDEDTLGVLRTRKDIACVLVNPVQAMHPNSNPPGDASLLDSSRSAGFDREAYAKWLRELRAICTERGIVLILDEIFVGFRLAWGGAQEYFEVNADLVTYGKTLGGGLPVGVLCGSHELMKRYDDARPGHLCFARGTFNGHPYVMGAMNAFLCAMDDLSVRPDYARLDTVWSARAAQWNAALAAEALPVRVTHMSSIFVVSFTLPSRYNWMLQFYLRAEGIWLSWVGSGRIIFRHDLSDADFEEILGCFSNAVRQMQADGWWEPVNYAPTS